MDTDGTAEAERCVGGVSRGLQQTQHDAVYSRAEIGFEFMLPDADDCPTLSAESLTIAAVSDTIATDLAPPERRQCMFPGR